MVIAKIATGLIFVIAGASVTSTQVIAQQQHGSIVASQDLSSRVGATANFQSAAQPPMERAVLSDQWQSLKPSKNINTSDSKSQWTNLSDTSAPEISNRRINKSNRRNTPTIAHQPEDRPTIASKPAVTSTFSDISATDVPMKSINHQSDQNFARRTAFIDGHSSRPTIAIPSTVRDQNPDSIAAILPNQTSRRGISEQPSVDSKNSLPSGWSLKSLASPIDIAKRKHLPPESATAKPTSYNFSQMDYGSESAAVSHRLSDATVSEAADPTPTRESMTGLKISDIAGANFADPGNFLKDRSFKFGDPKKYLVESEVEPELPPEDAAPEQSERLVSSNKTVQTPEQMVPEQQPDTPVTTQNALVQDEQTPSPAITADDQGDRRYLTVSDVNAPINPNPFGDLEQIDSSDIIQKTPQIAEVIVPAGSYSEFSGQYFQAHFASWTAHRFRHNPLYFEEANLERYGNQLRAQNLMSAAHFFTSAALLPYKMGQSPPHSCDYTLGYHRPGDCVPYQIYKKPLSKKGLLWQGLIVTALSL